MSQCTATTVITAPTREGSDLEVDWHLQCERDADHVELDANREWPVGSGLPEGTAGARKGGFLLTKFPLRAPVHRYGTHEWTDPEWEGEHSA